MTFKDKDIMVTGGAGFVGSNMIQQLLKEDVKRIVVVDNFLRGSRENLEESLKSGKIELIDGDIRDRDLINELMEGIDYCFHLAAFRITQCAAEPRQTLEVMYDGTFNVLESCVKHNVKKLMFASSASVYGQADHFPTKEDHHPYNNYTLYGAAKMANELMCRSFYQMHGLDYVATRYFNIYGPGMDTFGKYTEVLIRWYRLIKEGKPPLIFGDGSQTMDFVYIDDVARSSILAMKSDATDEVFNVASSTETSLKELCYLLIDVMGSKVKPEYKSLPDERKHVEVMRRLANVDKAKELMGFTAQIDLREGLKRLVAWLDQKDAQQSAFVDKEEAR